MIGFSVLCGFYLMGMLLHEVVGLPLPSGIIGLILLTIALFMKWVKLEWVEESAQFLMKHMMVLFAPLIVGTIAMAPLIGQHLIPLAGSLVAGSILVLLVTGWTVQWVMGRRKEGGEQLDRS
ncbi:CidA/LrgA family protein [Paenibacillus sp. y28]|uniref:CidA/LrgA family protein n=1 Tax=Paenibacillus sp. y28 TaxID=3129110 RepID=UPI003017FFE3